MISLNIVGDDFKHCMYSNNPLPPTSFFNEIRWDWSLNSNESEVVFYTNSALPQGINSKGNKNIAWLIEPYEYIPTAYELAKNNNKSFKYVFTHEKTLLDLGENYRFIPFGGCWIDETDRKIYQKNKLVSIVASNKTQLSGHRLRHEVINKLGDMIDVYGNGYNPIRKKITAFRDYMFSVVIENCKRDYWFTEKLIDALITGTVPIYWGCPSIGEFFNTKGFIIVDTIEDIRLALLRIKETPSIYEDMKPYIEENYLKAKQYVLAEKFIYEQYIVTGELL